MQEKQAGSDPLFKHRKGFAREEFFKLSLEHHWESKNNRGVQCPYFPCISYAFISALTHL